MVDDSKLTANVGRFSFYKKGHGHANMYIQILTNVLKLNEEKQHNTKTDKQTTTAHTSSYAPKVTDFQMAQSCVTRSIAIHYSECPLTLT